MTYTRLVPRQDSFSNWEQMNNDLAPNGLRLALGEVAAVVADPASGAIGLSNPAAQAGNPGTRLPNNGEIIYYKVGLGPNFRWDQLPVLWPMRQIHVVNGRKLGTTQGGKNWDFVDPNLALLEVFKAPYLAPTGTLSSNPARYFEVGEVVPSLVLSATVQQNSFRITRGRIQRMDGVTNAFLTDEVATATGTIGNYSRTITDFAIMPSHTHLGGNVYQNMFNMYLTDDRPSSDGGPNQVGVMSLQLKAVLPEFFGKSKVDLRADKTKVADVLAACTRMRREKSTFQPGTITYVGGEFCYYLLPKVGGPLRDITDISNIGQLNASGAFPPNDVFEVMVDINGYPTPYLVYQSKTAYGNPILLNFYA